MKAIPLVAAVALAILSFATSPVDAHTHLSSINIDGLTGECIRPLIPKYVGNRSAPIRGVHNLELTCGHLPQAGTRANTTCRAHARSKVIFQWDSDHSGIGAGIDVSHKGPVMVYMAPLASGGLGPVWFKIYEEGFDYPTNTWAVDNIIKRNGTLTIKLPKHIPSGEYLVRTEIISLQSAMKIGGAQFYVNCAEIVYSGGKRKTVPSGVAHPGAYKATDPGILFQLYTPPPTNYTIPGPRVNVK